MIHLLKSQLGRLRLIGYLEGSSLLLLIFVAVPLKHFNQDPSWVKVLGPIHGALFLWFIFNTLSLGVQEQWQFRKTTWKVLLACIVPFGTFYIDRQVLQKFEAQKPIEPLK